MKGYPTSYAAMFRQHGDNEVRVAGIEIPLIQRDYAQGQDAAIRASTTFAEPFWRLCTTP